MRHYLTAVALIALVVSGTACQKLNSIFKADSPVEKKALDIGGTKADVTVLNALTQDNKSVRLVVSVQFRLTSTEIPNGLQFFEQNYGPQAYAAIRQAVRLRKQADLVDQFPAIGVEVRQALDVRAEEAHLPLDLLAVTVVDGSGF